MPDAIISTKTRSEFREYFVGSTLREIREAFDGAGVRCDLDYRPSTTGERRSLVEQYYRTVNWSDWKSVSRLVAVYENELRELFAPVVPDVFGGSDGSELQASQASIAEKLLYWLRQDGFEWVGGKLVRSVGTPPLDELHETQHLEGSHLALQIQRIRDSVETDPALAIGTAKELVETVCKTILEERGKPVVGTPDIPTLTKLLLKELQLVPEGVPEERRGSDVIKAILRSLGAIGNDLAQLRGLYGTGHGKSAKTAPLRPRHAKLAVGAAATLVTFLFETHRESSSVDAATPDASMDESGISILPKRP
jgi:hypothetical protein